ncbi:VOC family protein [Bradyrhizobium sp. U87765 SZCCT0131]|uniref:VOC family protein n=1 Tax=unclassified Bradyrhizobium TaxID=2631580 RepID=UPI001BAA06F0|nr:MULTISPECIES: VOC family protein [unclassified Bradyrhizobium]MBR1218832.1 VOC family protein [Bradyrhizobium sp. U87765 SZCCT0131]MBR1261483.1 VOC family protein [Bradyrhizobium sp. U87765 SZCCT0134]MBR1306664.1 VOC family protein [Bradyrhizobium sp. U87765 SZCCT0110]MBR1317265.1 VOC family protein [Bradyrhizobium sp. U87765 SZCCT0109]MBR1350967.1 VOC family protein [Bradyrhizobium sp. U87765 SZCCT0048]
MEITALGYVGIQSSQLDDWSRMATGLLGMQQVDRGGKMRAFRMDDRTQRLIVDGAGDAGLAVMGWEVPTRAELDRLAGRLDDHGVAVTRGTRALADERHVGDVIRFHDPAGNPLEAFCAPALATEPFRPGRPITGFRTGALGMGHVVLNVEDVEPLLPFYRDLLGFHVSDFGLTPYKLYFFHVNGRHHSFAMVGSGRRALHHFMVEVGTLDDVGQGYDLAQLDDGRIAYTLGRHTNDHMTSFYVHTPSGFFIEYGWGGRVIEPETWQPHETFDGPSLWGHERLHLPDDQRKRLRDMRLSAAARGVRVADPKVPPLDCPSLNCPWLDAVIGRE